MLNDEPPQLDEAAAMSSTITAGTGLEAKTRIITRS
jgi:hypothetical protein